MKLNDLASVIAVPESLARASAPGSDPRAGESVAQPQHLSPGAPAGAQASRSGAVLALQARAFAHERFRAAATAVVSELALQLKCDRVSIGFHAQGRVRVNAMSNTADICAQQNVVHAIAAAMDEALDQRCAVVHPLPRGSSVAISLAHAELARVNGQASICTVPFLRRGRALGAIVFERRDGFDARALEQAKDAALFVAPILELKHRLDSPFGGRLIEAVAPRGRRLAGFEVAPWQLGAIALALGLVAVALWPATFRVVAPGRVEGAVQRVIAAPADGFVRSAAVRPGEPVKADQVLATLEDQDLVLERQKWSAEIAQLDKQYREALSKDDAAQIVVARSKLEQANTQLDLASRQIERASLRAPFDGVLISGDLSQSIGMPVKRGQELMTVAPGEAYRVVAEVDEQDIASLKTGQRARVMFAALAERPVAFTVTRIAPVATPLDGRNVFDIEGRLDAADPSLRPGLRGVARIDIDQRSLGSVWWERAGNWLRRTAWRVLG